MRRDYHRWYSPRLGRDMELLIFGHAGQRVLVFPTRDGRFHEYEDIGLVGCLAERIEAGELQLYCLDGFAGESFYCFWRDPPNRVRRHLAYEDYVLSEVLPFADSLNGDPRTVAHGCSLGAFSAASIAFRKPARFSRLVAFSGRYDLTLKVESFGDLLDGHYDDDVYFCMPSHFLPQLHCSEQLAVLRRLDIVLTIGAEDPFLDNNRALSHVLGGKGVGHQLHVWDRRAHSARSWRQMAPLYL